MDVVVILNWYTLMNGKKIRHVWLAVETTARELPCCSQEFRTKQQGDLSFMRLRVKLLVLFTLYCSSIYSRVPTAVPKLWARCSCIQVQLILWELQPNLGTFRHRLLSPSANGVSDAEHWHQQQRWQSWILKSKTSVCHFLILNTENGSQTAYSGRHVQAYSYCDHAAWSWW